MKTIVVEQSPTEIRKIVIDKKLKEDTQDFALAILVVVFLLVGCMFINPIVVFVAAGLLSVVLHLVRAKQSLNSMHYELGNDLLDAESIKAFQEEYER